MRVIDYIFLANSNLSRRKRIIASIVLTAISMLILIFTLSFSSSFKNTMERAVLKNISYRTVVVMGDYSVSSDKIIDDVMNIENVEKVIPNNQYESGSSVVKVGGSSISGIIGLYGANSEMQPNIISGRGFLENEREVCLIPKDFYPYNIYPSYDSSNTLDGEKLLGKEIVLEYYSYDRTSNKSEVNGTYTKKLTVVGVYDSNENVSGNNYCYIPFEDMDEINTTREENSVYGTDTIYVEDNTVMVVVDDTSNVDSVISKIQELGYRSMVRSTANLEMIDTINKVTMIVFGVVILIVIINLTISSIKSIVERGYEIGMLKAIGYRKREIRNILFTENLIVSTISYIITILLVLVLNIVIKKCIFSRIYELEQMNLSLQTSTILIAFIVSMIIPVITTALSSTKILKQTSVNLNKER